MNNMDIFTQCQNVNNYINENNEVKARNELIKILDCCEQQKIEYSPLINHLIRKVGLFPYIKQETALWEDRFVCEAFKVDTGEATPLTLHREQSSILSKLLEGKNLIISAPTSFGKSFIIDAFISIKKPKNIMIIVPTIALTDETRRRIHKKFSNKYKIITTSNVETAERNIFVFPQERAVSYINAVSGLDILIIDEFYKADTKFDSTRSPALLKSILKLGKKAKQKYFLTPNISKLNDSIFTNDMEFISVDFNTVFLETKELYKDIKKDINKKQNTIINILKDAKGKTLIYAESYKEINNVSDIVIKNNLKRCTSNRLSEFSVWLQKNYGKWILSDLVKMGYGIHNGNLHRSLSQIQIKLFEENDGLDSLISTSSIIEGVNTSAENIILWSNKSGNKNANIDNFTYKNIIGRGGRMFRHFVGKIYILASPPKEDSETQLSLALPDELIADVEETYRDKELTPEQVRKIRLNEENITKLIGVENYTLLKRENTLRTLNIMCVKDVVEKIINKEDDFRTLLVCLNSNNPYQWDRMLPELIKFQPDILRDIKQEDFVKFIKIFSDNWIKTFPELLQELAKFDITIDNFFKLERIVTFNFASLVHDINVLQKYIVNDPQIDISSFVTKLSHAFLPPIVYQLEEYGLPRMLSRKIQDAGIINFTDMNLKLHDVIKKFNNDLNLCSGIKSLDEFDRYILKYFHDGILVER